jgi:hypothetical protein
LNVGLLCSNSSDLTIYREVYILFLVERKYKVSEGIYISSVMCTSVKNVPLGLEMISFRRVNASWLWRELQHKGEEVEEIEALFGNLC